MSDKLIVLLADITGISIGGKRTSVAAAFGPVNDKTLTMLNELKGKQVEIKEAGIEDTE